MAFINMKYYNEDNDFRDIIYANSEETIKKYITDYSSNEYNKIFENDNRTIIYETFSEDRNNIFKCYNFDSDSTILEIGSNYGENTGYLASKCKKITAVEFSQKKAKLISLRHKNIENLEIICGNLKDIESEEKYDYIVALGIIEFYKQLGFCTPNELLDNLKCKLKPNGKILLAIDNKFGIKYLVGAKKYDGDYCFSNFIENSYMNLFGKKELDDIVKNSNFENITFLYPFPNWKITNVIYSDKYIPSKNSHKFRYGLYYCDTDEIFASEFDIIGEAIKNDNFNFFVNSFFVELTNSNPTSLKFANFNVLRNDKYKTMSIHKENYFEKSAYNIHGNNHIDNIKQNLQILKKLNITTVENINEENNSIVSTYINKITFDEYLTNLLKENKIELFYQKIDRYFSYLKDKLVYIENSNNNIFNKLEIELSEEQNRKLKYVENGFLDMIFSNVFYDNDDFIIYDQEWYEKRVPLEYLEYRAIKYLYELNEELAEILPIEEIFKKYYLTEFINIFNELDEKLFKEISNQNLINYYIKNCDKIHSIDDIKNRYNKELSIIYKKYDDLVIEKENIKKELSELYGRYDKLVIEHENIKKDLL